jgi:AcrR family transcriptional regulator
MLGRMVRRSRDAAQTRADLLAAARGQFAREGFERVTVRSVAAEVGVDQSLVVRYFGSKAELFAEAARVEFSLPDLRGLGPEEIADALVGRFFELFNDDQTFLALLRSAATSQTAADQMMDVFLSQAAPALAVAAIDRPGERAALVGSQMLGFAFVRYVLGSPPLAAMTREQMRAWVGPTVARYLTDPDLGPPADDAT